MYTSLETGGPSNGYEGRCRVDAEEPGSVPRRRGQPWLGRGSAAFNNPQKPSRSLIASELRLEPGFTPEPGGTSLKTPRWESKLCFLRFGTYNRSVMKNRGSEAAPASQRRVGTWWWWQRGRWGPGVRKWRPSDGLEKKAGRAGVMGRLGPAKCLFWDSVTLRGS